MQGENIPDNVAATFFVKNVTKNAFHWAKRQKAQRNERDYTLEETIASFINEFRSRIATKNSNNSGRKPSNTALASEYERDNYRGRGQRGQQRSRGSGRSGSNISSDRPTWDEKKGPLCYKCNKYGHLARDCPKSNNYGSNIATESS
jgi:hypothetical protein